MTTHLYNCKAQGPKYRVTKFDLDLNVEASYLVDGDTCECPRGTSRSCRHRVMLPYFLKDKHVDDQFFFNYDTRQFHQSPLAAHIATGFGVAAIAPDSETTQPDAPGLAAGVQEAVVEQPSATASTEFRRRV